MINSLTVSVELGILEPVLVITELLCYSKVPESEDRAHRKLRKLKTDFEVCHDLEEEGPTMEL
jgi:hypothetical protein